MSKYIIKNCPAYDYDEEFDYHICKQSLIPYECNVDFCQDCTDCVMKRIVEECKHDIEQWKAIPNVDILEGCVSNKILQLLQIEEIE